MRATIYHNPGCGTSRRTLAILEAVNAQVDIVPYLTRGWPRDELKALLAEAGLTPREALRRTNSPAEELGLLGEGTTDAAIFEAMLEHPVLVNRPLVKTPQGTRLCRPAGQVLDLLEPRPSLPVRDDIGTVLLDAEGNAPR